MTRRRNAPEPVDDAPEPPQFPFRPPAELRLVGRLKKYAKSAKKTANAAIAELLDHALKVRGW
jgi:hypothetical protein